MDFPFFPSGATFSTELQYNQEPRSGLIRGSLQPAGEMLTLHASCWVAIMQAACGVASDPACFGTLPCPSGAGLLWRGRHGKRSACPNRASKRLVLAWRGCIRQTVMASYFVPLFFFPVEDLGLLLCLGHPGHSGKRGGSVYSHTAEILGDPWWHSWEWVSFVPSWIQCQPSTARTAATCLDTFGIQVFILIAWLCLDLCLWFFFF